MSHLHTECSASGQRRIWDLAREILLKKGIALPPPILGLIMGAAIKTPPSAQPNAPHAPRNLSAGARRLYTIVMSESAHLIRKLRRQWRIQKEGSPAALLQAP
ncbi:hypothetical protein AX14_010837 [Amanita brunnescens Koide BX004]|nr:hypothetical protein AX14_010837 [Amanita brunnescens Koide BX004]